MGATSPKVPKWLAHALQGLAFWIGHRHSLFRGYPLTEGALVAEACNLIQANIPNQLILLPECLYRNLVPRGTDIEDVTGQSRADLVICSDAAKDHGREGDISKFVEFVIEVKRGSAPRRELDSDLKRLSNFLAVSNADARAFLFVVSEGRAPARFVSNGKSLLGSHPVPGVDGHFRVRRTVKAAASFNRKEAAHYVCLIELYHRNAEKSE